MESIMSDRGTTWRLVYPRDSSNVQLLSEEKWRRVTNVTALKPNYNGISQVDWAEFLVTIGTRLTSLKALSLEELANSYCLENFPVRALAHLFAQRKDTLESFDGSMLKLCSWNQRDTIFFCNQLGQMKKLKACHMFSFWGESQNCSVSGWRHE